jgi:hypothetical protein
MKKLQLTLLFIFGIIVHINAQVKGEVSGIKNEKLTNVNIYLANQYKGTTTNTNGAYELAITKTGKHSIIFQYLGYKTLKKDIFIEKFPYNLNVTLEESEVSLDIVNIYTKINPAIAIIKKNNSSAKTKLISY